MTTTNNTIISNAIATEVINTYRTEIAINLGLELEEVTPALITRCYAQLQEELPVRSIQTIADWWVVAEHLQALPKHFRCTRRLFDELPLEARQQYFLRCGSAQEARETMQRLHPNDWTGFSAQVSCN